MSTYITASEALPNLIYAYETVIQKDYGKVFYLPEKKTLICELTKSYVLIEDFKEIFTETVAIIEKYEIKKFVFDKQNLRVFHQPSMEWYFVHWKKEIYGKGLAIHRKILPKNDISFELAVEAGRSKIASEYKDTVIHLLDIQYKNTIEEAIES